MSKTVIGWTDAYLTQYPTAPFTNERKAALIERIRKRKYNFSHFDHEMMGCAPFYDDKTICVLTKQQLDDVMAEAYKDRPIGQHMTPYNVIDDSPIDGVLYEKKKFYQEGDSDNG